MANFQTHLNLGIVVSASAALALHTTAAIDASHTLSFFVLGVVGSLLPDIDSKTSKPAAILFNLIGAGLAFAMTMPFFKQLPPLQLSLIWGGVYLIVRHGCLEIFSRITVHRGIWHSLLATIAISLAITNVAFWLWQEPAAIAWLAGAMTGIGYLTHLILDELYSVDLLNRRMKRSFGTALKPLSYTDHWSNLLMLMSVVSLLWFAPSAAWLPQVQIEIPLHLPAFNEIEQYWHHMQRQFQ